jgi:hypothetical protein
MLHVRTTAITIPLTVTSSTALFNNSFGTPFTFTAQSQRFESIFVSTTLLIINAGANDEFSFALAHKCRRDADRMKRLRIRKKQGIGDDSMLGKPNANEERFAFSVRTHRRSLPTGQFRETLRRITLTFNEQHREAKIPVYKHYYFIRARSEDRNRVRSVVLIVCGNVARSAIRHSQTLLAVQMSIELGLGRELPRHQYPLGDTPTPKQGLINPRMLIPSP